MKSGLSALWRNARRWLPGVLISIVALVVVFRLASWQDLSLAFTSVRPLSLGLALALTLISLATRAFAWRILLQRKPSFGETFIIINEGYLLNNIFPLRAGEIAQAIFMGKATGFGPYHVLSTIVIERVFDLAMAAGLLLTTLPLALGMDWAKPVAILAMAMVVVGLLVLFLVARYHSVVHAWFLRLGERWSWVKKWVLPRLDALLDGLSTLTRPGEFILAFLGIAASWMLWVTMYYIMLLPLRPDAPYYWAMFLTGVLAMGIAVPAAPGGLGVFEAALVGALAIFGISPSVSLAYAIIMHLIQFVSTGVFGFFGLVRGKQSLQSIFSELGNRSSLS